MPDTSDAAEDTDIERWYDGIVRGDYTCFRCGLQFLDYQSLIEHITAEC